MDKTRVDYNADKKGKKKSKVSAKVQQEIIDFNKKLGEQYKAKMAQKERVENLREQIQKDN